MQYRRVRRCACVVSISDIWLARALQVINFTLLSYIVRRNCFIFTLLPKLCPLTPTLPLYPNFTTNYPNAWLPMVNAAASANRKWLENKIRIIAMPLPRKGNNWCNGKWLENELRSMAMLLPRKGNNWWLNNPKPKLPWFLICATY